MLYIKSTIYLKILLLYFLDIILSIIFFFKIFINKSIILIINILTNKFYLILSVLALVNICYIFF